MTRKLFRELSTTLLSKCPKVYAVGLTKDEHAMVLATFPQEYIVNTKESVGYVESGVYDLTEDGVMLPIKVYHSRAKAHTEFDALAKKFGWQVATNQKELKKLLKSVKLSPEGRVA